LFGLCLFVLLQGCAGVPFDYPKTASTHHPASAHTHWGAIDVAWEEQHGAESGFIGLGHGIDGLGARLRLMERAEATIDAQYFILKKDLAGTLFAGELLRAADRGVRVRLLVDDIFSPGVDAPFTLLDRHHNIEVRIFNPVARGGPRYWNYVWDFRRANRRMHNKSFIVDNAMAVVGGRNIGEEYFELDQNVRFDDFEVLAIGPIVDAVSDGFDQYWNSDLSVPMRAFDLDADVAELDEWRTWMRDKITGEGEQDNVFWRAIESDLMSRIASGERHFVAAPATMVADPPDKLQAEVGDRDLTLLANELARRFRAAREEIVIITPYFIPQETGVTLFEELLAKGIRVMIITNSLASTNHVPVYAGYRRYRDRLLRAGAEMYEVRPDVLTVENAFGLNPAHNTLHSKFTIVDRSSIFVGSLNFDPRSIFINSEMGLFIESSSKAEALMSEVETELDRSLYRLDLDDQGRLRWTYQDGEREVVLTHSPQTSWWRRLQARFYAMLPIEDQL